MAVHASKENFALNLPHDGASVEEIVADDRICRTATENTQQPQPSLPSHLAPKRLRPAARD